MKLSANISTLLTLATLAIFSLVSTNSIASNELTSNSNMLVTATWLSEHLNDDNLVLLDTSVIVKADENGQFKSFSGRAIYETTHIPTAGFADLVVELSNHDSSVDFAMPTPEQFAIAAGKLGIGADSKVVLYSTNQQVWPARLWWMLRWAGFDNVAILDGGITAWTAQGGKLSSKPATHVAKVFPLALQKQLIADSNEVLSAISNPKVNLVDALPSAHFQGKFSMYARPGHIISATNMPSSDLIDESGLYKSLDELEMMHDLNTKQRVITYCGGGVAASSVAFTMVRLGYKDVAVYMGSLNEWAEDSTKPMTTNSPKVK